MSESPDTEEEKQESIVTHLVELRDRLIKIFLGVAVALLALFPFAKQI